MLPAGSIAAQATTVEVAIETQPDVIVLDMHFPDADGRDILSKLKSHEQTARIPVLVWSGRGGHPSDSRISLDLGAEDYIEKDDAQLMLHKLERVLLRLEQDAGWRYPRRSSTLTSAGHSPFVPSRRRGRAGALGKNRLDE